MADTIERLYKLTVDGQAAAKQLGDIARATDSVDKSLANTIKSAQKFATVIGSAVSAGAIVAGVKGIIDSFDQLSKDAAKVGIAAEELQRLRYAADLSGVSSDTLDKAIGRLATGMVDLAGGTSETAKALRQVGAQTGEDTLTTLKRISDQFQKMPDGVEKTALAIDLFGKAAGPDLIPMLNAGGDALQDLANEADKFGGVISGPTLKAAEAFNDNLSRLQRVASGVGAQLTAGALPALQAISQSLIDSAKNGEGFVSTGEKIGDMLATLYGFALKAASTIEAFGLAVGAAAAAATDPLNAVTIFEAWREDVNALERTTNAQLEAMRANLAKFKAEAKAPPEGDTAADAAKRRTVELMQATRAAEEAAKRKKKADDEAKKAADEHRKSEDERWKALIRTTGETERLAAVMETTSVALTAREQKILETDRATIALNQSMQEQFEKEQAQQRELQILTEWLETGTEAQKAYASAQLAATASAAGATVTMTKQRDELDVLTDGFNGFFENLGRAAGDIDQVFKRTVQSILAELLKLWAKRYIIEAIFGTSTGGSTAPMPGATGFAFDASGAIPFARGGVINRPVVFPMALAGEAGPEAILPLKRTASGDLGVQAESPPLNVTINNYSDASVTATRTGPNDLQIIIEQTRAAIAADVRSGGNVVARSFEQAYGIGRGAAAAF